MKSFLQRIAERQHFDTVEDFYAAIGYGGVSLIRMMPHIKDEYNKIVKRPLRRRLCSPSRKSASRAARAL